MNAPNTAVALRPERSVPIAKRLAERFAVDESKLMQTLKATAFKQKDGQAQVTDEQMTALMIVADQYKLNPFTKELYAYPDKQNGIVPVVSVDGWSRIINEHHALDGIEFRYSEASDAPPGGKPCPEWCEVVISRKDRAKPIVVREYLDEVYRAPFKGKGRDGGTYEVNGPWQSHTKRMLRHKTLIQGSRIAFGFAGIYDEDEAQRIIEREVTAEGQTLPAAAQLPAALPAYDEAEFTKNLPTWQKYMDAGMKTAADLIAMIETKYTLTEKQKKQIRGEPVEPTTTETRQ